MIVLLTHVTKSLVGFLVDSSLFFSYLCFGYDIRMMGLGGEFGAAMETMESCVPPGFRFHPTDEELVGYYLRKKVAAKKIDLDVIRDIDLYRIEPWDLQGKARRTLEFSITLISFLFSFFSFMLSF